LENLVDVYRARLYYLVVQKLRGSPIEREEAIIIKSPDTLRASRLKPVSELKNEQGGKRMPRATRQLTDISSGFCASR
jgi:hypothetical protein